MAHRQETPTAKPSPNGQKPGKTCSPCTCDGRGMCRSCAQLRVRAWRLVMRDGLTEAEAAGRMGLTIAHARLLLAQEHDSRELKALRQNWVDTAAVRTLVDKELQRDPEVTRSEVAHWLNMRQIDFDRQLGYRPGKNGRVKRRIGIPAASRIVIALGRAPHELDGC